MAMACCALLMTGCVSKKKYAELQTNYDQLRTEHTTLQGDYNDAKVRIAEYTSDSKSLAARLAEEQKPAEEQKVAIDGKTVKLTAKAGANGKLFGAVTAKEIAEGIEKQVGTTLEKRKIVLKEDIKAFGSYTVEVKIYNGVSASLYVIVGEE